ncbi:TetR/AcrR family transcriptional regulator [Catenulispora yoronensis]|uniref:TetR/AcrR family transcriptional regulator n=2 Tax=Catenulispora yoronensis TaxID=450799 RepID=A0ABN2V2Q4_9ACTN
MRVDAARNLEAVLTTGAYMFAADPSVSIASIAAVAGVDRRTVYRQFASREELLEAIYEARLLAVSRGIEDARLSEAPVVVALHRYVENLVAVNRVWPVDVARMLANANEEVRQDWDSLAAEVDAFLQRAVDEGLLRSGLPEGWARVLLTELVQLVARQRPELNRGQAADVVVDTLLYGIGAPRERSGGLVG